MEQYKPTASQCYGFVDSQTRNTWWNDRNKYSHFWRTDRLKFPTAYSHFLEKLVQRLSTKVLPLIAKIRWYKSRLLERAAFEGEAKNPSARIVYGTTENTAISRQDCLLQVMLIAETDVIDSLVTSLLSDRNAFILPLGKSHTTACLHAWMPGCLLLTAVTKLFCL